MKKIALLFLLFSRFAVAKSNYHGKPSRNDSVVVHVCALSPFSNFYAEAAMSEQTARNKTSRFLFNKFPFSSALATSLKVTGNP